MKKATKVLALMLCAVLLVTATVAGTLAYLTSSDTVENTFTVGSVTITLDEACVNEYGEPIKTIPGTDGAEATVNVVDVENADRTDTGNEYKLIPGHTYTKDPTIHVGDSSEKCYLFAKIENGLGADATITCESGWTKIEGTDFYKYNTSVSAGADVTIFKTFTFASTATPSNDKTIKVTAYAIQADGSDTVADAWSKLNDQMILTTNP